MLSSWFYISSLFLSFLFFLLWFNGFLLHYAWVLFFLVLWIYYMFFYLWLFSFPSMLTHYYIYLAYAGSHISSNTFFKKKFNFLTLLSHILLFWCPLLLQVHPLLFIVIVSTSDFFKSLYWLIWVIYLSIVFPFPIDSY